MMLSDALEQFNSLLEAQIQVALKTILEQKHLYQTVRLDVDSIKEKVRKHNGIEKLPPQSSQRYQFEASSQRKIRGPCLPSAEARGLPPDARVPPLPDGVVEFGVPDVKLYARRPAPAQRCGPAPRRGALER